MSKLLERLKGLRDHVIPFAGWEMFIMRLLCALLIFRVLPDGVAFATAPFPNGLGRFFDFTFLAHPGVWPILKWLTLPCLVFYVLGIFSIPSLAYLGWLLIAFGSLRNSQGAIGHTTQLVTLVVLAQLAMAIWKTFSDSRQGRASVVDSRDCQRMMIHAVRIMIAAAYLTTAISKIDRSNGSWLWDTPNLSVQIVKTQANQYYNTLEKYDPFLMERLPEMIAGHPWLSRIFFAPGLLIELLFPLALIGRRWSLIFGLGTVALHQGIKLIMGLEFEYHEILLWIFFVNVPYWIVAAVVWLYRLAVGRRTQTA